MQINKPMLLAGCVLCGQIICTYCYNNYSLINSQIILICSSPLCYFVMNFVLLCVTKSYTTKLHKGLHKGSQSL